MAHNKVLKWFGKNEKNDEEYYMKNTGTSGRPYKIQWQKPHETKDRELWKNNTLGKNFQSSIRNRRNINNNNYSTYNNNNIDIDDFVNSKRHQSLPIPPRTPIEHTVDTRRFGINFNIDNNALDSYFAQEHKKDVERKQRESLNSFSDNSLNDTTTSPSIRSRKDSQRIPNRESHLSVKRDNRISRQEDQQQSSLTKRDSRTSYRESQQLSIKRDNRTSRRESNISSIESNNSSNKDNDNNNININNNNSNNKDIDNDNNNDSNNSNNEKPPLPKKSPSRYKERKIPGTCSKCKGKVSEGGYRTQWCHGCESKKFESKFGTWTSGNDVIDTFILESQLSAESRFDYLEWIPFDKFKDVQLIGSGGLGSVYQAIWLDGPREKWDKKTRQYVRCGEWRIALRSLDNSEDISLGYFDELKNHLHCENNSGNYVTRCYGITQNTATKDYMIVVQYARNGDLWKYMNKNSAGLTWKRKLDILYGVATGLYRIHSENIVHKNLHSGNVLINAYMTLISDLGLSCRADSNEKVDGHFGILPYIAPEILKSLPITTAVDVYSFGTIMWEMAFGRKPFHNRAHSLDLAKDIVNGLQPEIISEIPECYLNLMKDCWNLDPLKRPTSRELYVTFGDWLCKVYNVPDSDISIQFSEFEKIRLESIKGTKSLNAPDQIESPIESPTHPTSSGFDDDENVHPKAIFKSRHLKFESLHEPKPIITFTKTYQVREHLAIKEYIISETNNYNLKHEMIEVDNTEVAAEIYEILQYL